MFNNDPLSENAGLTGMKSALVMFAFLMFIGLPMMQLTIGSQLNIMSAGLNGLASSTTKN
jgi:hypothetical protein